MSELEFGSSDEEVLIVLKIFAQRVNSDLYNHGRDGLLTRFNGLESAIRATEATREKMQAERHRENGDKLEQINTSIARKNMWIAVSGAIIAIIELVRLLK